MSLRFTRDKWVQMKKLAAFVLWPNFTERCKSPFFSRKRVWWLIVFPHKIKQKHFFLEKKYETIPRPKKEAAVGNMLKNVLAIHNVPLHLK